MPDNAPDSFFAPSVTLANPRYLPSLLGPSTRFTFLAESTASFKIRALPASLPTGPVFLATSEIPFPTFLIGNFLTLFTTDFAISLVLFLGRPFIGFLPGVGPLPFAALVFFSCAFSLRALEASARLLAVACCCDFVCITFLPLVPPAGGSCLAVGDTTLGLVASFPGLLAFCIFPPEDLTIFPPGDLTNDWRYLLYAFIALAYLAALFGPLMLFKLGFFI